jgi:creatinine amidohydrolase
MRESVRFDAAMKGKATMLVRPPSGKKVLWQELLRHELLDALKLRPVVIVPVGSIEQHGPHCPQDVDISIPYHLAIRAADAVTDFPVIVAPPVTYGFTHYNMGEVGTISLGLETFINVLCDVSRSIWANGFHRLILLNGHGGNEQPTWSAAVKLAEEDVWPLALTYWNMAPDELLAWSQADDGSIGHGGEWETSLQLYLRPNLVDMTRAVKDEWRLKFTPEVGRYARFPERRREMEHGVMGDPHVASAEKGERLFTVLLARLVGLCGEYHDIEPPRYREFGSHSL